MVSGRVAEGLPTRASTLALRSQLMQTLISALPVSLVKTLSMRGGSLLHKEGILTYVLLGPVFERIEVESGFV